MLNLPKYPAEKEGPAVVSPTKFSIDDILGKGKCTPYESRGSPETQTAQVLPITSSPPDVDLRSSTSRISRSPISHRHGSPPHCQGSPLHRQESPRHHQGSPPHRQESPPQPRHSIYSPAEPSSKFISESQEVTSRSFVSSAQQLIQLPTARFLAVFTLLIPSAASTHCFCCSAAAVD